MSGRWSERKVRTRKRRKGREIARDLASYHRGSYDWPGWRAGPACLSRRLPPLYNLYPQNCSSFRREHESMPFLPPGITIKSGAGASNGGSAASTEKEDPPIGKFANVFHSLENLAHVPPSSLLSQLSLPPTRGFFACTETLLRCPRQKRWFLCLHERRTTFR